MARRLSFKGLENRVYYMLENGGGTYRNYSGCGNTLNGNHPIVREMIFHCLRYWVHNYHVDGFRFDLASILSRNREGELVPNPPVVESIGEDPLLADTKIIAEAWDAAGGYQVGTFGSLRWAEWNGHYRDDLRRFWRGDSNMVGLLATRLAGSSDLYQSSGRKPYHSINFITSHDGFTLNDLVSYSEKHNEANGENNRRRREEQLQLQLRRGGAHAPRGRRNRPPAADQEHDGLVAVEPGRAHAVGGRRMPPHASRATTTPTARTTTSPGSTGSWSRSTRTCGGSARRWWPFARPSRRCGRPIFSTASRLAPDGLPDVSWFSPSGGQVDWSGESRSLVCLLAAAPPKDAFIAAEPSRADAVPRRRRRPALHLAAAGTGHGLAAVRQHGGRPARTTCIRCWTARPRRPTTWLLWSRDR